MSRSYRKFPVSKESHHKDYCRIKAKDFANRAVRRYRNMPTGKGGYKKIYDSYFISDYRIVGCMNETELKREYENGNLNWDFSTYQETLWFWKKWYIRK